MGNRRVGASARKGRGFLRSTPHRANVTSVTLRFGTGWPILIPMSNRTPGKFNSLRDEVVHRATLDGTADTMGDVQFGNHYSKLLDFYGYDYIVIEDDQGFVTVERYDHIDIDESGYFTPVERAWSAYAEEVYADDEEEEDES